MRVPNINTRVLRRLISIALRAKIVDSTSTV